MKTKEIDDMVILKYPFLFRNNRGGVKTPNGYITFGIPCPPKGRGRKDKYKGGDRIGFIEKNITKDMVGKKVAIFTSIEIKGPGDKLKEGQKRWHNFVLEHHGISEIWTDNKIIKERL